MNRNSEPVLTLTFGQAVDVLTSACGLESSSRSAIEARIRQLQRAGVPRVLEAEGGQRPRYGLAELSAFATAFRLMSAFMVPALAARYVIERWDELAPFLLAGAKQALSAEYLERRPLHAGPIAIFQGNALNEMGQKERHDGRYGGQLGNITFAEVGEGGLVPLVDAATLVLDGRTYMPELVAQFVNLTMASEAELVAELDRVRFS